MLQHLSSPIKFGDLVSLILHTECHQHMACHGTYCLARAQPIHYHATCLVSFFLVLKSVLAFHSHFYGINLASNLISHHSKHLLACYMYSPRCYLCAIAFISAIYSGPCDLRPFHLTIPSTSSPAISNTILIFSM